MLVSIINFDQAAQAISQSKFISLDTETTGLHPYNNDSLFSVIISTETTQYYFNFNRYLDLDLEFTLPKTHLTFLQNSINSGNVEKIFMHNAKFDLAFLARKGIWFSDTILIHDTETIARLIRSDYDSYSLDNCARRIGLEKDDAVMAYLDKHKLFIKEKVEGKKKETKKYFFDQIPVDVIVPYGLKDAEITYALGMHQLQQIKEQKLEILYENETRLTRTCFEMERRGIRIDREYCTRAKAHELTLRQKASEEFQNISGIDFCDSGKVLAEAFSKVGIEAPKTELGNPSFTDKNLAAIDLPLAQTIRNYREANKKAGTYYSNFLELADKDDYLHANIRQSATFTGRFAMAEPNLQNVTTKEEAEKEFKIRKAFIPRDGFKFYELDYKAMEFRLLLDYAGERELCTQIINGLDPHQATADLTGLLRPQAKTLNFGLVYGMGAAKLAIALKCSLEEAKTFKRQYFDALPRVQYFIKKAIYTAKTRGYVFNWAGKKYYFPDPNDAFKAPNAIIQGGSAEITKFAMNTIANFLALYKTRMVLQVHDSILLEVAHGEEFLVDEVKKIMCAAYKQVYLPMDVSVSKSEGSWADMEPLLDSKGGEETGNEIQGEGINQA